MSPARNLSEPRGVEAAGLCIGCGVCAIAFPERVSMTKDETGFLSPSQSTGLSSAESELFVKFCPGTGYRQSQPEPGSQAELDPMWGPIIATRDGWALDESIRHHGSSGGALTALAAFLLAAGKVDAVVGVTGGSSDAFRNDSVVVRDPADVELLSGSRYSPADPFTSIVNVDTSDRVAVIGKPCDIAALRLLRDADASKLPKIEYFLSFFCAGTPGWRGTESVIDELKVPRVEIRTIRYRGDGWPGYFTATANNGATARMTYEESWGKTLNRHLHTRCKVCQDGMGVHADIVAADSWDVDARGYPVFDDGEGRSLLISRTSLGEELLREAEGRAISTAPTQLGRLPVIQPSQEKRKKFAALRAIGFALGGRSMPRFPGFARFRWIATAPREALAQAVGSFRRARADRHSEKLR